MVLIKSSRAVSEEGKCECSARTNAEICSVVSSVLTMPLVPLDGITRRSYRNQHFVIRVVTKIVCTTQDFGQPDKGPNMTAMASVWPAKPAPRIHGNPRPCAWVTAFDVVD